MDFMGPFQRSAAMSRVRGKNTKPELVIRKLLFLMGFRYRLHLKDLPGKPDIVFTKKRKIIFVHGCFWHQHKNCSKSTIPKTKPDWWREKLERNILRDTHVERSLAQRGWSILVIWECEIKQLDVVKMKLMSFLK